MGVSTAVVGSAVVGGVASDYSSRRAGSAQRRAARSAASTEMQMFEETQELLRPYVEAGEQALQQQQNFLGMGEPGSESDFIEMVQSSPGFYEMLQAGEDVILQNASATGGLRGGNTQRALAEFSPFFLNQQLLQRFNMLGGMADRGQAAAARQAGIGTQVGSNLAGYQTQIGQANAGEALARGNAFAGLANSVGTAATVSSLRPPAQSPGVVGTANNTYGVLRPPAPVYGVPGAGTTFGPYGPQF